MKLIHPDGSEAKIGDLVTSFKGEHATIKHFVPPHKPSSLGHVSVDYLDRKTMPGYNYVSVWGLAWIEREDRNYHKPTYPMQKECVCRSTSHCERYGFCG